MQSNEGLGGSLGQANLASFLLPDTLFHVWRQKGSSAPSKMQTSVPRCSAVPIARPSAGKCAMGKSHPRKNSFGSMYWGWGGSLFLPALTLRSGSNGLPAWGTASGDGAVWGIGVVDLRLFHFQAFIFQHRIKKKPTKPLSLYLICVMKTYEPRRPLA